MMKHTISILIVGLILFPNTGLAVNDPGPTPATSAASATNTTIADFENMSTPPLNNLGGAMGAWNLNPMDINNSYTDDDFVETNGIDGKPTKALQLTYSVESEMPSQNGFWTKLQNLDATQYDHLQFDVKGDSQYGFTDKFKVEMKKCKKGPCQGKDDEVIKGSFVVNATNEWQTISIPLNKMTGILDFSDPKVWENPAIARKNMDEFVIVFQDRHVSQKKGRLLIDNVRLVKTGDAGPTAVDFPPRKIEKTPTKIEGLEFQKFLLTRLKRFPTQIVVKKTFPDDPKQFLMEIAKDTWRFFDEIVDKEHGLPLDTIQLGKTEAQGDGLMVGDYTNVTNIGVYLMCLVSAYDLGFIPKEEAIERLKKTMTTMEKVEYHSSGFPYNYYDTTTLERTSHFISLVDSGWLVAGLYVAKNAFPEELSEQASRLLARGNFSFFYDPVERQMFHGFYDHLEVYSDYHYGVFYTEPRAASYIAIARSEAPEEHWFDGLIRTFPNEFTWQEQKPKARIERETLGHHYLGGYYEWKDLKYVPSWGGSAFEALMPTLILKEKELATKGLGLNDKQHALGQIRYAKEELSQPVWGMSPSSVPEGGYSEYGAKPFGSKGYKGGVVTPHASVLALEFASEEVIANLHKLIELYEIYGEYGFYDAVTVSTGLVARKYLALDQGMIFVAINNYLNDGAIRKRFHNEPIMQQQEKLLSEENFFPSEAETSQLSTPPAAEPKDASDTNAAGKVDQAAAPVPGN